MALRHVFFEMCLLGTGILKGPFSFDHTYHAFDTGEDEQGNMINVHVKKIKTVPKVEAVSCWDFYADPNATSISDCDYVIQRHSLNRQQFSDLRKMPYFNEEAIDMCLEEGPNYQVRGYESSLYNRETVETIYKNRFEVLEYWGVISKDMAEECGIESDKDVISINAWICGGKVLRMVENPFEPTRLPFMVCPYELNPYQFFGIGVPENMEDSQQIMNGHARMAIDNLAGATQVRSPSGPMPVGSYLGSGVNLATYATPFGTSLAGQAGGMFSSAGSNFATQGSIGLSSAPPASLAGQGAGSTATSSGASAMKVFGQAASIYGIYDGIKNKDYFSAGTALITLLNPATAIPIAVVNAAKMLFGAWSASKRPKPKFGGAEFKAEKNRLMATEGYGYNGYQPSAGKATVASIADYVNTYVKTFGLQFNGTRWAKAIEADPRLNRYDTMDDSGYRDPSVLARKIFETDGLITGTPTYFGQPITSQEDYKAKMEEFNEYYKKTALERGGLVDAAAVGIDPDTLSNEHNKITFKVSNQVGGGGTGRQYTQRTTGGGRGGGGTTQTGYWQTTGTGGRGGGNRVWVPAAPNVVVDQWQGILEP